MDLTESMLLLNAARKSSEMSFSVFLTWKSSHVRQNSGVVGL
jgi:hypothetical protein